VWLAASQVIERPRPRWFGSWLPSTSRTPQVGSDGNLHNSHVSEVDAGAPELEKVVGAAQQLPFSRTGPKPAVHEPPAALDGLDLPKDWFDGPQRMSVMVDPRFGYEAPSTPAAIAVRRQSRGQ
jgi:hypothetical protein